MILIKKAEEWRNCNHCYNDRDVYNVLIRYEGTNSGTEVALCKECLLQLANKITNEMKNNE